MPTTEKGWLDDVREREEWARNRIDAKRGRLVPDRHPQQDFFVADFLDAIPKDDTASMEHPLFALQTGDKHGVACPAGWKPGDKVVVPAPKTQKAVEERLADSSVELKDWYLSLKKLS